MLPRCYRYFVVCNTQHFSAKGDVRQAFMAVFYLIQKSMIFITRCFLLILNSTFAVTDRFHLTALRFTCSTTLYPRQQAASLLPQQAE